jgi:hypothetical protein
MSKRVRDGIAQADSSSRTLSLIGLLDSQRYVSHSDDITVLFLCRRSATEFLTLRFRFSNRIGICLMQHENLGSSAGQYEEIFRRQLGLL